MRINTTPLTTTQKNESLNKKHSIKTPATPFGLDKASAAKENRGSLPISRSELVSLAADFKNGVIDREQANKRFIQTVINNSIAGKLGEKDREQIIYYIKEFFSADPNFETELAQKLKDFA